MIADEVIPGTDITDMVEGVSGNKNLRNVKFVLCSSKQHRNYLDFVFSTIGDKAVVRLLEQPYDEKRSEVCLMMHVKDAEAIQPSF